LKRPIDIDGAPVDLGNQERTFPQAFFFPDLDSLLGKHKGPSIERRSRGLAFPQGYELVPRDFAGLKEHKIFEVKGRAPHPAAFAALEAGGQNRPAGLLGGQQQALPGIEPMRAVHSVPSRHHFLKDRGLLYLPTDTPGRDEQVGFLFQERFHKVKPVRPKLIDIPRGGMIYRKFGKTL
jgi:hypothetical protein